MLACVDVGYRDDVALAGCVVFQSWPDSSPVAQAVVEYGVAAPYRPGEFYLRELPPIIAILSRIATPPELVVVDGYVWLGLERPGLGARLHASLGGQTPVIGVAKTPWHGAATSQESGPSRTVAVRRGASTRPLYVTAAGVDVTAAASFVLSMHGEHRIPTLLRAVDRLVRQSASK